MDAAISAGRLCNVALASALGATAASVAHNGRRHDLSWSAMYSGLRGNLTGRRDLDDSARGNYLASGRWYLDTRVGALRHQWSAGRRCEQHPDISGRRDLDGYRTIARRF